MLLHEIVDLAATTHPEREALVADGRRLTFTELAARIHHMSNRLEEPTQPGDRVALVADNTLDAVVAMYAVPRRGAALAPANTRHTADEIGELLHATSPTLLLGTPDQIERLRGVLRSMEKPPRVFSIGGDHPHAELDLTAALDDETAGPPPAEGQVHHVAADPRVCAWIIHTSGTTGRPKGAMLTHASLVAAVLNTAVARPVTQDDVYLFPFPLFHVAAYNVLHVHLRGRPVILIPRFDAKVVMDTIAEEGVTSCSLAPTMIMRLLNQLESSGDASALSSLRQISYGASSMPIDLLRRILTELPDVGLAQGYGMTELSGNAVFLGPDEHRRAALDSPHLLNAAGRPGPLVALRIEDEHGDEVPPGGQGEILVRGDQVVAGYWQDPVATSESRSGPWLRTGDIGLVDDDGYLHVVDRKKDIIITGGENVASREVEDVVGSHPLVDQVAVIGVPDEHWGETVCAVVVAASDTDELDTDELMEWTRGRLAGFKRPKRVVVLDEMPVNASGKVDKHRVRELAGVDG